MVKHQRAPGRAQHHFEVVTSQSEAPPAPRDGVQVCSGPQAATKRGGKHHAASRLTVRDCRKASMSLRRYRTRRPTLMYASA